MEILNNIGASLTTPNEQLTNTIVVLMGFFESMLTMYLFLTILKIESNRKQKILYVLLVCILSIFTIVLLPNPFNIFANYIINLLLIMFIFKISVLKSILAIICSVGVFGIVGSLITNPYLSFFNISSENLISIPLYRIGYALIMYTFIIMIILAIKYRKLTLNYFEDLDRKTKFTIIFNISFGFITLIIQCIILTYYIDILPLFLTFLSFISLLAYFCISIFSLTRILKLTMTTRKLESAESYNNTLRILHDNVRAFKHDFDNIVTTIGGYIKTNDMEGLKKYYVELEDDCEKVNNLYILNPEIVNNDGVYNLLTKKYYEAESKDIKINITFLLDISKLHMKIYEFARILGILLDNAIEASSECEEKVINLFFRNDEKNSRELIIIENTYNNKDVDTEKIFLKGESGKQDHSGLGLWEVRKIIKKYNNVNLYTTKNERLFSQQLEIYY